jgi:hypothetical protein
MWKKPFGGASQTRMSSFATRRDTRRPVPSITPYHSRISSRLGTVRIQDPPRILT